MSALFQPFTLKDVTLRNRIAVPPMCQYSAIEGVVNDWHLVHLAGLARGGADLVIVEATAVSPEGRITPNCTGLWNDEQAQALVPAVEAIKAAGAVPGIQIGHAGRKASANRPWEGDDHVPEGGARGWQTIAPSAIPYSVNLPKVPKAMTRDDIVRVRSDFTAAARRARDAGFRWLDLHPRTAIWARASSPPIPISATMPIAGAWRTAVASCWKHAMPCARSGPRISP
jgi:2,4-dienoyl-CoA reductase-like NADH-dependent reductase (Old Yellow Enzyme family)